MFEAATSVESAEILQSHSELHELAQLQLVMVGSGVGAATLE
jgi:hypothetical protein